MFNALDDLIRSRSILQHPFYRAWQCGQLGREQLEQYATVYYPHVAAFPDYLKSAIAGASDPATRAALTANLGDELATPKPHAELWLDFAEEVGADRHALVTAEPHPAAAAAVATFRRLTSGSTATAVVALYAYESQQPEVSREKATGLIGHYGIRSPRALAYFDLHASLDVEHRDGHREAIARCLEQGADEKAMSAAADEALSAYWQLLDGVCDAAGIERV